MLRSTDPTGERSSLLLARMFLALIFLALPLDDFALLPSRFQLTLQQANALGFLVLGVSTSLG